MLQVRLLGQFDVRAEGKRISIPTRAGQSLFAFLVLNPGVEYRREQLAGLFWPDSSEENARRSLRTELWRLRKTISAPGAVDDSPASEYFLTTDIAITFNRDADYWLDAAQLLKPVGDLESLTSELALYRGELLPGFYDEWVSLEREHLYTAFENKMQQLLERLCAQERWVAVQDWAEKWLALDTAPEPAYRALMMAYGARGDTAQVTAVYQRCGEELQAQLGVEPSAETRALYETLRQGVQVPARISSAQPFGKHVVTAGADKTARLWDAQTGVELRQFIGHVDLLWSVAFSLDGKYIATASGDGTVRIWDVQTGKGLRRLVGHTAAVENVVFSPDGKYVLSGSDDGTARLWDVDYRTTMNYLCSRLLRDFSADERAEYDITDDKPTCP